MLGFWALETTKFRVDLCAELALLVASDGRVPPIVGNWILFWASLETTRELALERSGRG